MMGNSTGDAGDGSNVARFERIIWMYLVLG